MRVICEKGFYKFYPQDIAELARFQERYETELVECEDFFTFLVLAELPNFSIKGQIYSGILPGLVSYAGKREDVLAENGYCFSLKTETLILTSAIFEEVSYSFQNFNVTNKLPQAYGYDDNGVITGFSGFIDVDFMRYKIERFFYD